ncbi:MAG: deoxyhypusine synthase family protein [Candidatus Woesearchaeota archaeon]
MSKEKARIKRGDGISDGLVPLKPIDLEKTSTINDLVSSMLYASFNARALGEAAEVLEAMIRDEECYVVLTLAGAMTPAKMGLVACDMIDRGMVNCIVTTGALLTHGFVESVGKTHFKYEPGRISDWELYLSGYDRIYDTIELEKNLDETEEIVNNILSSLTKDQNILSSWKFTRLLGEYLHKNVEGRGILKSAYEHNIPVFIPALTDSELGLDIAIFNLARRKTQKPEVLFDLFADLEYYSNIIKNQKTLGIFTIGGGVPRNWAQQIGPFLDIINLRLGKRFSVNEDESRFFKRFKYGVRISTALVQDGGLSGCTYSEGVSWGKFMPKEEGGRTAEVFCDATIAWPIIVKAVMERLEKNPPPKKNLPTAPERFF